LGPHPNPQSPIPNPQSPILIQIKIINILYINIIFNKNKLINLFNNTKMAMAQAD